MRNGETIGPALLELPRTESRPPNIGSWEEAREGFDWSLAERELGWGRGDPVNIGWNLSDRICRLGLAQKPALLWEGADGQERPLHLRRPARPLEHDRRVALRRAGVGPGERVCLFLDRVPELYLAFVGILKLGAVVQPLFSAFGEESLAHAPPRRRDLLRRDPAQAPAEGAPRPRDASPTSPRRRRRRRRARSSGRARSRSTSTPSRASRASTSSRRRPRRRRSSTTPRGRPDSRRGRSTSTARSSRST